MEVIALTCPQCGSSAIKLLPESNDLAQCNYCSTIFVLPPPPPSVIAEPKLKTAAMQEEEMEEEEDVDMTAVVYPVKPAPPAEPILSSIFAGGLVLVGGIYIIGGLASLKPAPQQIATGGVLFLLGCIGLIFVSKNKNERLEEYNNSEEMQEYLKAQKAAVDKS